MPMAKSDTWNKIIDYHNDGYLNEQIANMTGLTKQRVSSVVRAYESCANGIKRLDRLSDFQIRNINKVIYPNIRKFLLKEKVALRDFCQAVSGEGYTYHNMQSILTGEEGKITIESIKNILSVTGLTFEEAFSKESENETDCVE